LKHISEEDSKEQSGRRSDRRVVKILWKDNFEDAQLEVNEDYKKE
jgi:hypothetical protein